MRLVQTFYFYRERRGRGLRGRRRHSLHISDVVGSRAFRQLSRLGLRARTAFSQFWFGALDLFVLISPAQTCTLFRLKEQNIE